MSTKKEKTLYSGLSQKENAYPDENNQVISPERPRKSSTAKDIRNIPQKCDDQEGNADNCTHNIPRLINSNTLAAIEENILKEDTDRNHQLNPNYENCTQVLTKKKSYIENVKHEEMKPRQTRSDIEGGLRTSISCSKISQADIARSKSKENVNEANCTFKPKINEKSIKLAQRPSVMTENITEILYKDAYDRNDKVKKVELEVKQSLKQQVNSQLIHPNSKKIIRKKLEDALKQLIKELDDDNNHGYITFENLGVLLCRIGIFHYLEFQKIDKSNQTTLNINQAKIKSTRMIKEMEFHENFWKILSFATANENYVDSSIMFDFLIVLIEEKNLNFASKILNEYMERITTTSNQSYPEDLWPIDKLINDFNKIFDDKTIFMTYYLNNGGGRVDEIEKKGKFYEDVTFKPKINPKSKAIDAQITSEIYQNKTIPTEPDENKQNLKTRFDILFEHHKYLKEKRMQMAKEHEDNGLKGCTFKPQTTHSPFIPRKERRNSFDEKNDENEQTQNGGKKQEVIRSLSPFQGKKVGNQEMGTWKDMPKVTRHELLYDVAKVKKEKLIEIEEQAKKRKEEEELAKCTFKPIIYSDGSHVREESFNANVPKGYQKTIERLQRGVKEKEGKARELERISRGENYEKLRQAQFNPPKFLQRQKIDKKGDLIVFLDVNIGHGKTGRIGLHRGDNAKIIAKNFARAYSLNHIMRESLEKLLQSYIDSNANQPNPDQELKNDVYINQEGYDEEIHKDNDKSEFHKFAMGNQIQEEQFEDEE